jgi:tripartite-type tricarboxylate transporter receptor subunit TctC
MKNRQEASAYNGLVDPRRAQRSRWVRLLQIALLCFVPATASAQSFPSRPITLVVPFPAGGPADIGARTVMQQLSESIGQPVLIENRSGAGGQVGASAVKIAPPDGYTLLLANIGTHAINQTLYTKLSYDPVKDFTPVSLVFSVAHVLVVNPDSPVRSVNDLVKLAKENPGKLSFASQGVGSGGHLLGEMLKHRAGIEVVHVPYRGTAQALPDLLGGRVQFFFDGMPGAGPLAASGKLRGLAVTDHARAAMIPDVPNKAEAGFPNFELSAWFGVAAPAGTPREIVDKLHDAIVKATRHPESQKKFMQYGIKGIASTPEEFAAVMREDTRRLGEIVQASDAHAE